MTGPPAKDDLPNVQVTPIDSKQRAQKRTKRLQNNDIAKLVEDFDLNDSSSNRSSRSHASSRPRNGKADGDKALSNGGGSFRPSSQPRRPGSHTYPSPSKNNRAQSSSSGPSHSKPHRQAHRPSSLKALSSAEHTNIVSRFVLKSELNVSASMLNVDTPIAFKEIWRVFQPVQECPICLEKAEVPRMLSCGHVMCLHCMMNHRKYSEMPDVCPICAESVSLVPSRTAPVTFLEADPQLAPKEDEEVVLTLMSRTPQSPVALPTNLDVKVRGDKLPAVDLILWTRLSQASVEYAKHELASELRYLLGASKQCVADFGSDVEGYMDAASELKRIIHNLNLQNPDQQPGSQAAGSGPQSSTQGSPASSMPSSTSSTRKAASESRIIAHPGPPTEQLSTSHVALSSPVDGGNSSSDLIYFYQTFFESSTVYTLSALDVSILKAAYGSYENFPTSLITKISNIEHIVLDRADRRFKFLSHLPEQIPIALLECDWRGVVDEGILRKFKAKLSEREAAKRRKRAKETAEDHRAQAAIDMQFQVEIAEAMLPHDLPDHSQGGPISLDTSQLPTLDRAPTASREPPVRKKWVDERTEYEELMKNAYVTKKGRKNLVLRL